MTDIRQCCLNFDGIVEIKELKILDMESLSSLEEMRNELELLEEEENKIDKNLETLIKQQPDLLVKGILF